MLRELRSAIPGFGEAFDLGPQRLFVQHVPARTGAQIPAARHLHRPRCMWEGALARVGVVHPLGEEPAMEGPPPAMPLRHLLETPDQGGGQAPGRIHARRWQALHQLHDLFRPRVGCTDVPLQRLEQSLALADATDRVELRAGETIRRAIHIVRNYDAGLRRIRLVQDAVLPEVLLGLGVLKAPIQRRAVEVPQQYAACVALLVPHEVALQRDALAVLPSAVPVRDLLQDLGGRGEGCPRLGVGAHHLLANFAHPLLGLRPCRIDPADVLPSSRHQ
mmetsp:Transcript_7588/g.21540  ORF Transcript_7588/g.21540 Transcript_7588/m.21540 type:complete len:276 (+) Transcript_7588:276-1103(+)